MWNNVGNNQNWVPPALPDVAAAEQPLAEIEPPKSNWGELGVDLSPRIVRKLDLKSAKALRLTNAAFGMSGTSRFTGADVPAAAEIHTMVKFFRDSTNICTLRITDKENFGDQHMAQLVEMLPGHGAKIDSLDLSGCIKITNAGLDHLTKMTKMQSLNLNYCGQITDAGLGHLSNMTAMQSLNLFGCNQITDTGLNHLSRMTAMQSLNLFGCNKITDAGIDRLSGMTTLRSLNLILCTRISESKVMQLRASGIEAYWWQ
jgi:hypothetical protein